MSTFTRIKTGKNGRQYRYLEERWREGGKMCSRSRSLGPVGGREFKKAKPRKRGPLGILIDNLKERAPAVDMEKAAIAMNEEIAAKQAALQAGIDELHARFGLTLGPSTPVPVEAPALSAPAAPEAAPEAPDGQSDGPAGETGPEG